MCRKRLILICLILIFVAPGIIAYLIYKHPQWLHLSLTNKGTLVRARLLHIPHNTKWGIVLVNPGMCDILCLQELDRLNQIRLALGRKYFAVDLWLSHGDQDSDPISWVKPKIFIITPKNYLVLTYPSTVDSGDIFQDLRSLLKDT